MNTLNEAKKIREYMLNLRNYFHANPELGFEEFRTADKIEQELNKDGIKTKRIGKTGIVGTIDTGRAGKTLFMRADIDALPIQDAKNVPYKSRRSGIMHACGHDGHTASLLGAAKLIPNHIEEISGRILLAFQPAEEIGGAARTFIDEGILDGVDRIYGIHFSSSLPVGFYGIKTGECMASCDRFKITIRGKSAHITRPQDGADALFVGAAIAERLQTIVPRLVSPVESALVGIGKFHSGTAYNILAGEAVLEGTTRAFSEETRNKINTAIRKITEHTAEEFGAEAFADITDIADACVNDKASAEEHIAAARKIVPESSIVTNIDKRFGSDNFADFMRKAPGCYTFVGSRSGEATGHAHHNEYFDLDPDSLVYAAALHLQYALDFLA